MMIVSTGDAASGGRLPIRVQTYIEALVQTCARDRAALVSVALFGSAAKGGFSGDVCDVDVIIVVSDAASRAERLRLGEDIARLESLHELRSATSQSPGGVRARIDRIIFASIVASAMTVWGEDLLPQVPVPPLRRLDVFKRSSGSPAGCC